MSDPTGGITPPPVGLPGFPRPGSPTTSAPPIPDAEQQPAVPMQEAPTSAPEQPPAEPPFVAEEHEPQPTYPDGLPIPTPPVIPDDVVAELAKMTPEQRAQIREALSLAAPGEEPPVVEMHPSQRAQGKRTAMPESARLNTYVYVRNSDGNTKAFGPQDIVPTWARALITNEAAWAPPEPTDAEVAAAARPVGSFSKQELYAMEKPQLVTMAEQLGVYVGEEASMQDLVDAIASTKQ